MYFSVSQTAALIGVCLTTIRRWDYCGLLKCFRTPGGHRRIGLDEIQRLIGKKTRKKKIESGSVFKSFVK